MPLEIIKEDITRMRVDAIVNTTNQQMVGTGGVDRAVHAVAGAQMDEACARLAPLGLGQVKLTRGFGLPCKYVIHTSGPTWQGGLYGESIILRACYLESLKLAMQYDCRTVAFPLISAGAYGYPKEEVLRFAVQTITEFLFENELTVFLCVLDKEEYTFNREIRSDITEFINCDYDYGQDEYFEGATIYRRLTADADCAKRSTMDDYAPTASYSLREYVRQMDKGFRERLFDLIDESGMTDVECYKKANVDKRTFSKIKSNKDYKPSKQTVIAFAISLRLDMDATQELLATAGFTLSESKVFDMIIMYFIYNGKYDIFEINEALFEFDQMLLGV